MTSSYRNSRPPWRSPSQNYSSTPERPSTSTNYTPTPERPTTLGTNSNRFLSGSSYRALTGNSAMPARTYSDSSSVTVLKDKFSSIARDKAVLADKRMRIASSGFGQKPTLRTGSASRFGAPIVRSPIKEQSVTVFGVCNVPELETESPVDVMVSVVTRGTSPTPPAHSTFLRSKHAGQQEFTMSTVTRKNEKGVDVNLQTDERFLRNMPSLKVKSSIPVARFVGSRSGYSYPRSKDSGSTSDNSGQEQDSYHSDSSSNSKSRSNSAAEMSKLPQPNRTRNRSSEKSREESGVSRSPSLSSTAEEKPPTGRKNEEPKLVTIKSIAPVSGIAVISEGPKVQYPLRKMDSTDQPWWLHVSEHNENNNEEPITLNTDTDKDFDLNMNDTTISKMPSYSLRKMDSSDRNRWLQEAGQSDSNERSLSCTESISCSESTKSNSPSHKSHSYVIRKMDSSDRNRWLQEAAQEDVINEKPKTCASSLSNSESIRSSTLPSRSPSFDVINEESINQNQYLLDREQQKINTQNSIPYIDSISNQDIHANNKSSIRNQTYSVRKMDSFDTPWWLKEEKSSSASDDLKLSSNKEEFIKSDHSSSIKSPEMTVSYGVRKMDSFDSPWWLSGDEAKQANSLSDSNENKHIENKINESFLINPGSETNINEYENQWRLKNSHKSQFETNIPKSNENSIIDDNDNNNYSYSNKLEPWNNDYPSVRKMDSSESQWWEQDQKNADARSTSVSIDWSRDGPELSNPPKSTPTDSPMKILPSVRKMDSFDSPSWLASEESESQSHEPKHVSSVDVLSSDSKQKEDLVYSSPDWWGENNQSDDFVRTKRTSLRIKKIDNVVDDTIEKPNVVVNTSKEPNLQDELDQLMLFIGGCRNIDELLGNEEPPPAAPTTPPDTDSDDCVEVGVDQVHIHDSTAQMSTIQKKLTTVSYLTNFCY